MAVIQGEWRSRPRSPVIAMRPMPRAPWMSGMRAPADSTRKMQAMPASTA